MQRLDIPLFVTVKIKSSLATINRFISNCNSNDPKTYHQVMKEKLPGLTQLLVEHHVTEIIDEVTCGNKTAFSQI